MEAFGCGNQRSQHPNFNRDRMCACATNSSNFEALGAAHCGTGLFGRKDVNATSQSRCPHSRGDVGDTRRDENDSLSTLITTLCMSSCLREGQILVKRPNTTSLFAPFSSPFEDCALNPFCFLLHVCPCPTKLVPFACFFPPS